MFKELNILDESDEHLRKKSKEIIFPLNPKYKKTIEQIILQLRYSQIEETQKQYQLRPAMGLAFPQLGINEQIIVIVHEEKEKTFKNYVVVNPKIVSHSIEMIAANTGEGCLSVNREVEGHVPRYARVTIKGYDINGGPFKIRAREELAIAFQHEIDHLKGILFFDKINKEKPFFTEDEIRLI